MTVDMLPAVQGLILSKTSIERVFGEELPSEETPHMPRECVVVKSGGGVSTDFVTVAHNRIEIRCYGETPYSTRALYLQIYDLLKNMKAQAVNDVWMLSAVMESGPFTMRDPDTRWPFALSVWMFMSREIAISGS